MVAVVAVGILRSAVEVGNRARGIVGVATDIVARLFARSGDQAHGEDVAGGMVLGRYVHWCIGEESVETSYTILTVDLETSAVYHDGRIVMMVWMVQVQPHSAKASSRYHGSLGIVSYDTRAADGHLETFADGNETQPPHSSASMFVKINILVPLASCTCSRGWASAGSWIVCLGSCSTSFACLPYRSWNLSASYVTE